MTIQQWLKWATAALQKSVEKIDHPRWEAEWLLLHVLSVQRDFLYTYPEKNLTDIQITQFKSFIARRLEAEPLAYILGEWSFRNLILKVTPETLIPRPETEQLIDLISAAIGTTPKKIIDLGTGSGAIALALAQENPHCEIWASDANPDALAIAKENAQKYHLSIRFFLESWYDLASSALKKERFDVMVSNPPYLAQQDPHLQHRSLQFEPLSALSAGPTGLEALQWLVSKAPLYLKPEGLLFLEHGCSQSEAVSKLLKQQGFTEIEIFQDNYGHDRFIKGTYRTK